MAAFCRQLGLENLMTSKTWRVNNKLMVKVRVILLIEMNFLKCLSTKVVERSPAFALS